eukprot:1159895-Pelagomonas_calceolata.AAC.2
MISQAAQLRCSSISPLCPHFLLLTLPYLHTGVCGDFSSSPPGPNGCGDRPKASGGCSGAVRLKYTIQNCSSLMRLHARKHAQGLPCETPSRVCCQGLSMVVLMELLLTQKKCSPSTIRHCSDLSAERDAVKNP